MARAVLSTALRSVLLFAFAALALFAERRSAAAGDDILHALTDVRFQTAEARVTGAPATTTLRVTRVATRGLTLEAPLTWLASPGPRDLQCLAMLALATRHGGLSRNRGRGHLQLTLNGDLDMTKKLAVAQ